MFNYGDPVFRPSDTDIKPFEITGKISHHGFKTVMTCRGSRRTQTRTSGRKIHLIADDKNLITVLDSLRHHTPRVVHVSQRKNQTHLFPAFRSDDARLIRRKTASYQFCMVRCCQFFKCFHTCIMTCTLILRTRISKSKDYKHIVRRLLKVLLLLHQRRHQLYRLQPELPQPLQALLSRQSHHQVYGS